jgi:p-aminobenzoyl-glutamate transporter AbgT
MNFVDVWTQSLSASFNELAISIGSFLPNLVSSIVIFLVGLVLASFGGRVVESILRRTNIDGASKALGVNTLFKNAGFDLNISGLTGWLVKWFIVLVFLIAVADALDLPQVSGFINQVASYIPNVIAAALILIIGVVVANALSNIVHQATRATSIVPSKIITAVTKWSILVFTFFAALHQLGIAPELIQILLTIGISLGFGSRDEVKKIIEQFSRNHPKNKN